MEINRKRYGDLREWIKNPICKVLFAGWESDTYTLQKAGWQIAIEEDVMRDSIHMIMKYEPSRLYAVSESVDFNYMSMVYGEIRSNDIVFVIKYISSRLDAVYHADMGNFRAVNTKPMISSVDTKIRNIEDFNLFTPLVDTREILIEPKDVNECLERILKFQSPKQLEIKEKKRKAMEREGFMYPLDPSMKLHAQLLTVA